MVANSAMATIRRALDNLSRKSVSDGATLQHYDGSQPATQQGSMHRTTGNDLTRKEDFYGMRCTEPQIEECGFQSLEHNKMAVSLKTERNAGGDCMKFHHQQYVDLL
jgi:hypothetical protein